ncbi:Hypothetical protein I595_1121 [Croceitalea dokdonensis DOKDO 023]|uniref:Glycosyltransferase n=1 Tax=Croceitalea dokdonensis DOKDO 023 TaxID=1300341 RepID=A0A0P7AVP8_9FLAO|nr:TIGR04282 family arsenosugar biosynthesis glycosyltransferase [Croceitalea dokdonensis]KPM32694.1 Hypothetical protein I595_1121 [Croceitalea dokdonensis DOKDO 023]
MKNTKNLLLIFTRNPELGKCKTRLAATTGNQLALEIYKFLLQHTANLTKAVKTDKVVYYSEEIWEEDIWDNDHFQKRLQKGIDLGERMLNAFTEGSKAGYERMVIIGSDMYDLSPGDIEQAFSLLDQKDFVIGPAKDGGYYLLGMKKVKKDLFSDKAWGTGNVLKHTLNDLQTENYALLDERNDVDIFEDIKDVDAFEPFIKKMNA